MFKQITIKTISIAIILLLFSLNGYAQNKITPVDTFNKVIISPHLEVVFQEGEEESVKIESINLPIDKFNAEVKDLTLHLYLDGAKITSPTKKEKKNGWKQRTSIYKGTQAKVIITYKEVNTFALRGEEKIVFKSPLEQEKCTLNIYGESQVYIKEANIDDLKVVVYGESFLEIMEGETGEQKFTVYGEGKVDALNVTSEFTKITAYGDGHFKLNAQERLKITAFGEPTILHKGNAKMKAMVIGEAHIKKLF
ncbi:DUF2807 domain-containing protein [Flavobacteriaceae bacterium AU392]|nr:DUF2807 domain-containing protein [Flavobacteriaceae bacterium]RKM83568.1 DUF2807 domain-containing protein [Flavobacteriaceae bacterium AU392]